MGTPDGELAVTCKQNQIPLKHIKVKILQYYKFVIQIIDNLYGLIYTTKPHITPRLPLRGQMSTSRVYEPIYTV